MEFSEFSAKTVNEAITEACTKLGVASDRLEVEVVEEGSAGFLGIGSKPAVIKARIKEEVVEETVTPVAETVAASAPAPAATTKTAANSADLEEVAKVFLYDVFKAMKIEAVVKTSYDEAEKTMDIEITGDDMGMLIGKRGQTLDSLQYLVSLVVNKGSDDYIRVKVDTENYRARRKETLENLARNISFKVKRTKRSVSLEPMNPYERRIIHSALQNDKYVTTHSEGEEPFRRVVITLKK